MTPAPDWNGTANIMVTVSDGFLSDSVYFALSVTPVNDSPTIDLPESVSFSEDGSLVEDFSEFVDDIDEDLLTLTVSDMVNITASIDVFTVTFGAVQDYNGTETLTFTINDSQGRAIASDEIDVTVTPVNDAPVLTEIVSQEMEEDSVLVLVLDALDVDEDGLTFASESDTSSVVV